jgi:hypothetical protein
VQVCRACDSLEVSAFGSEPDALLEETFAGLEPDDCYATFATDDSGVCRLHRKNPGLRLLRVPWLYDVTCLAILQQRIRTMDAMRDWRRIRQRFGSHAPLGLRPFLGAKALAATPQFELERMGIDAKPAKALLRFRKEMQFVWLRPGMGFAQLKTVSAARAWDWAVDDRAGDGLWGWRCGRGNSGRSAPAAPGLLRAGRRGGGLGRADDGAAGALSRPSVPDYQAVLYEARLNLPRGRRQSSPYV